MAFHIDKRTQHMCRVCMSTDRPMVNIFVVEPNERIPIVEMLSQDSGLQISKADGLPQFICYSPCLQNARNEYKTSQLQGIEKALIEGWEPLLKDFIEMNDCENECMWNQDFNQISNIEVDQVDPSEMDVLQTIDINEDITIDHQIKMCRVCMSTKRAMVNIFDVEPNELISIAEMISQGSGHQISQEEDELPQFICCSPCLQDARDEYKISRHLGIESALSAGWDSVMEEFAKMYDYENGNDAGMRNQDLVPISTIDIDQIDLSEMCFLPTTDIDDDYQVKLDEFEANPDQYQKDIINNDDKGENKIVEGKPFKCTHCSKSYCRSATLALHNRVHTGERPFKCIHCPKAFSQSRYLRDHIRVHTGERPFKCSDCHLAFKQKGALLIHRRTHTDILTYICSKCEKTFGQATSLQVHMWTCTQKPTLKCSHCQKEFALKYYYNIHMATHAEDS